MTLLVFLLTAAIGGVGAPLIKFSLTLFPPILLIFLRALLAAILILPFVPGKLKIDKDKKYLFTANILFALNWIVFAFGIERTSIIMAQNIYLPTSIIVAIFAYFYLYEKLTKNQILGLITTTLGLGILLYSSVKSQDVLSFGTPFGNLLVLTGLISWSAYVVISRKIAKIYSPQKILLFNFLTTALMALVFLPLDSSPTRFTSETLPMAAAALAAVAIFSGVLFFSLNQWLVKNTSAFISSLVLYPAGIIASVIGIAFFGEKLTPIFLLGSLLVFAGVFIATSWQYAKKYIKL